MLTATGGVGAAPLHHPLPHHELHLLLLVVLGGSDARRSETNRLRFGAQLRQLLLSRFSPLLQLAQGVFQILPLGQDVDFHAQQLGLAFDDGRAVARHVRWTAGLRRAELGRRVLGGVREVC
jgi:hypothetical protein